MKEESVSDKVEREVIVHKLLNGTATQQERDTALASMMLSLWTYADLKEHFLKIHEEQCAKCPAKQAVTGNGQDGAQRKLFNDDFKEWIIKSLVRMLGWGLVIIGSLTGASKILEPLIKQ